MSRRIARYTLMILLSLSPVAVFAAGEVDDIRILIDVSGSMKQNDPANLRVPALKLINGLIPTGSRAGVWTFGRYVNGTVKWGTVNDAWRKLADEGAGKIHSSGLFTNIESVLKRASTGWEKDDPKTNRIMLLLTDGQVDISKDAAKNEASRQRVLDKSLQALQDKGVQVHTIALSQGADQELLKQLALETGGSFVLAETAEALQKAFFRLFERASQPDTVAIEGNTFKVDKSISELTLLIFRPPGSSPTYLHPPEGREISARNPGKSNWRVDEGYDLVTIKEPMVGVWKVEAIMDPDNRLMVVTELQLDADGVPAYLRPSEPINLSAALYTRGNKISKNSFLRFVEFTTTHIKPDGEEIRHPMQHTGVREDKGSYLFDWSEPLETGMHSFVVEANARTFSRSQRIDVEVQWPVIVDVVPAGTPGQYRVDVSPRGEYLKAETLEASLQLEAPDGSTSQVPMNIEGNLLRGNVDTSQDGLYRAHIEISAIDNNGDSVDLKLEPYSMLGVFKVTEPEVVASNETAESAVDEDNGTSRMAPETRPEEGLDMLLVGSVVGAVNLLLVLIGVGVWWAFFRRKSTPAELNLVDED